MVAAPSLPPRERRASRIRRGELAVRRVSTGPTGIPVITDPTAIPGLAWWYRADLGIVLNGSLVRSMADQSGNGISIRQLTAANEPTYHASGGANNQAYIDLSQIASTNTFLNWAAEHAVSLSAIEIFAVVRKTAITAGTLGRAYVLCDNATNTNGAPTLGDGGEGSFPVTIDLGVQVAAGGSEGAISTGYGLAQNVDVILDAIFTSGAACALNVNGVSKFTGGTLSGFGPANVLLDVGQDPTQEAASVPSQWGGWFYEAAGWYRGLTSVEQIQVSRYMGTRYAITVP